jgi:hypothetical protein
MPLLLLLLLLLPSLPLLLLPHLALHYHNRFRNVNLCDSYAAALSFLAGGADEPLDDDPFRTPSTPPGGTVSAGTPLTVP